MENVSEEAPSIVMTGEIVPKFLDKSKYRPEMCSKIIDVAKEGGHIASMMLAIDCKSERTWYDWQDRYPEFKEAVEAAKLVSKDFYERLGLMGIMGQVKNFNATTYALIMNNKFKDEYSRGTNGPSSHTEITFNTVKLPPEQVTQKIAQKLEKLKNLGVDLLVGHEDSLD